MEPPTNIINRFGGKNQDQIQMPKETSGSSHERIPGDGMEEYTIKDHAKLTSTSYPIQTRNTYRKTPVAAPLTLAQIDDRNTPSALLIDRKLNSPLTQPNVTFFTDRKLNSPLLNHRISRSRRSSASIQEDFHSDGSGVGVLENANLLERVDQLETRSHFLEQHNNQLIEEKMKLSQQLGMQTQVNNELKKLLVASIGEDLQVKYERMILDKTQVDLELSHLHTVMEEDREDVEQALIQADVWRSKFLATRVMTEELTRWKSALYFKYTESHTALQKLLEEHAKIRAYTNATRRHLVRIAEHLNCKDPSLDIQATLPTVDIAFTNQDMAEALQQVLSGKIEDGELTFTDLHPLDLGDPSLTRTDLEENTSNTVDGDSAETITNKGEIYVEANELSAAEELAQEVILNTEIQTEELSRLRKDYMTHNRISHFFTTNYNVTFSCCENCQGKLKVM